MSCPSLHLTLDPSLRVLTREAGKEPPLLGWSLRMAAKPTV